MSKLIFFITVLSVTICNVAFSQFPSRTDVVQNDAVHADRDFKILAGYSDVIVIGILKDLGPEVAPGLPYRCFDNVIIIVHKNIKGEVKRNTEISMPFKTESQNKLPIEGIEYIFFIKSHPKNPKIPWDKRIVRIIPARTELVDYFISLISHRAPI